MFYKYLFAFMSKPSLHKFNNSTTWKWQNHFLQKSWIQKKENIIKLNVNVEVNVNLWLLRLRTACNHVIWTLPEVLLTAVNEAETSSATIFTVGRYVNRITYAWYVLSRTIQWKHKSFISYFTMDGFHFQNQWSGDLFLADMSIKRFLQRKPQDPQHAWLTDLGLCLVVICIF